MVHYQTRENYVLDGDATDPDRSTANHIIIPHIVNDRGEWGSGFVNAITARWGKLPRQRYLNWYKGNDHDTFPDFKLGAVQYVQVEDTITIANMVAQHDTIRQKPKLPPIRYGALTSCMYSVCAHERTQWNTEIHCPMFGSGLAGGNWQVIESLINEIWVDNHLSVTVYKP